MFNMSKQAAGNVDWRRFLKMLMRFDPASLFKVVSATVFVLLFQGSSSTGRSSGVPAEGTRFARANKCDSRYAFINKRCLHVRTNLLVINAKANKFSYAYGPSIIYSEGIFHMYFCSRGTTGWDDTRHATSSDLIKWSTSEIVLNPTKLERADCDPAMVRYDAGDGPYYYLFYGGNILNVQTVIFVARSASPAGPFLKYTDRGTWEANPPDSHVIFWPFHATPDNSNIYGAGQPTVVVMKGMLYMWYTDSTQTVSLVNGQWTNQVYRIYFVTSRDGINWSTPIEVVESDQSVDVKFDPVSGLFFMFESDLSGQGWVPQYRTSVDGINWSAPNVICSGACVPAAASLPGVNPGVSGDARGYIIPNKPMLFGFMAPYNFKAPSSTWGQWNLWGLLTSSSPLPQ